MKDKFLPIVLAASNKRTWMSIPVVLESRSESGGTNHVRMRPFSLPVTILSILSWSYSPEASSITATWAQHKFMNSAPHTLQLDFTVPRVVLLILCVQCFVASEMLVYINGIGRVYFPLNVSVVWTDLYWISLCKMYVYHRQPLTSSYRCAVCRTFYCMCMCVWQTDAMHKRKTHPMFVCS